MKAKTCLTALMLTVGCGAEPPASTTNPPTAPAPSCITMKGDFDASAWQGLVDSLPQGQVTSDVGFAVPSVLRAQVYDTSSWVTVGESAKVRVSSGDTTMSFGGTGYPADSSGKVTEVADYRAARKLFDLFVRANESKKMQQTQAAGVQETITRTSVNGKVECVLWRQDVGGQFPREDAYCTFHGLSGASMTKDCL
jgi:hypothetical protein